MENWIDREYSAKSASVVMDHLYFLMVFLVLIDCSQYRYMWVLHLLLQLLCVTIMFVVIMLLKIKGSSCPWNIIIIYSQLTVNAISHLHHVMPCLVGKKNDYCYLHNSEYNKPGFLSHSHSTIMVVCQPYNESNWHTLLWLYHSTLSYLDDSSCILLDWTSWSWLPSYCFSQPFHVQA